MHIGRKIKVARVAKGWSQEDLADKINKTRPLVSHIENTGKVNANTLTRICKVLGVSVEMLENQVLDGSSHYSAQSESALKKEIRELKDKIVLLEDLIATQKEVILALRTKTKGRYRP